MQWASAISTDPDPTSALTQIKRAITKQLGGRDADLVCVFVSPHYGDSFARISELVRAHFSPRALIGCTAAGIVGGEREIELQPALSLCAARLPGVDLHTFHLDQYPGPDEGPEAWEAALGVPRIKPAYFVLLADPMGPPPCDPRALLAGIDYAYPNAVQIGGLASVIAGNTLFLDEDLYRSGLVGVALQGNVQVDTIVAQGCRPIGPPMTITTCEEHILHELDGQPAFHVLAALYQSLPSADQERMRYALHLGVASTELKGELEPGDYLMRNVIHMDQDRGFLAIGEELRQGQTVQFHLRDADSAREDLDLLLDQYQETQSTPPSAGALLFTCTGRGQSLFGQPDHDSNAFFQAMGEVPLGGFFCDGEIGPVGGATYLHGYTSSFGLFRPLES
jgi:small ligand-binding sensory domain FIST